MRGRKGDRGEKGSSELPMAEEISPVSGWSQSEEEEWGLAGLQDVGQIQERKT